MRGLRRISSLISGDKGLSEFEKKVYLAVAAIPRGEVRTYGWVARRAGRPGASRAVGNALNKNPFAPAVPCHRVVRSDGTPGGFSRGCAEKVRMLRSEGIDLRRCRLL